jgi:hypothetical protein
MKDTKPTHTTAQTDTADIPRERIHKFQTRPPRYSRFMKSILGMLLSALIISVYVLAHRNFSSQNPGSDPFRPLKDQMLEVEVLDGAGNTKVAQYVTNVLRSQGYDVVEMKRNIDGIVERSYVVDCSGNLDAARELATTLGIVQDKVFQKINRNLYLDVTVVVGKDFARLKVFQALNERTKR